MPKNTKDQEQWIRNKLSKDASARIDAAVKEFRSLPDTTRARIEREADDWARRKLNKRK